MQLMKRSEIMLPLFTGKRANLSKKKSTVQKLKLMRPGKNLWDEKLRSLMLAF